MKNKKKLYYKYNCDKKLDIYLSPLHKSQNKKKISKLESKNNKDVMNKPKKSKYNNEKGKENLLKNYELNKNNYDINKEEFLIKRQNIDKLFLADYVNVQDLNFNMTDNLINELSKEKNIINDFSLIKNKQIKDDYDMRLQEFYKNKEYITPNENNFNLQIEKNNINNNYINNEIKFIENYNRFNHEIQLVENKNYMNDLSQFFLKNNENYLIQNQLYLIKNNSPLYSDNISSDFGGNVNLPFYECYAQFPEKEKLKNEEKEYLHSETNKHNKIENINNDNNDLENKKLKLEDIPEKKCKEENHSIFESHNKTKDKINDINKIPKKDNELLDKNKNMLIKFISNDQSINFSMSCAPNDKFVKIEYRLYDKYPLLRDRGAFFLTSGRIIHKSATLKENYIKNGDIILVETIYDNEIEKNKNFIAIDFMFKGDYYPMVCNLDSKIYDIKDDLSNILPEIGNHYVSFLCKGILMSNYEKTLREYGIIKGDKVLVFDKRDGNFNFNINTRNEEYILVHFISQDQQINTAIRGNKLDDFFKIENELYNKFPNIRDKNCFFLGNGGRIEPQKTLKENGLENGDKLIIINYINLKLFYEKYNRNLNKSGI